MGRWLGHEAAAAGFPRDETLLGQPLHRIAGGHPGDPELCPQLRVGWQALSGSQGRDALPQGLLDPAVVGDVVAVGHRAVTADPADAGAPSGRAFRVARSSPEGAPAVVDSMFRHAHSVKGMASSMGFEAIATLAHRVEDLVHAVRSTPSLLTRDIVDLLLSAADVMMGQVRAVSENSVPESSSALLERLNQVVLSATGKASATCSGVKAGVAARSAKFFQWRRIGRLLCGPSLIPNSYVRSIYIFI